MTIEEVEEFIEKTNGKLFSIRFKKRTPPHDVREMLCRTGVKKALVGGEANYDASQHELIRVYDMKSQGYRSIPKEGIFEIKQHGEWVPVTH